jgi:anti-sigma regulatory factor (Ser/Thr protein kinase)
VTEESDAVEGAGGGDAPDPLAPPEGGDPILGAALEGLRLAAEEVEAERSLAEMLQRSLLRERLPDVPGVSLAARYIPGSTEARVGGDWYDAVALRDGRLAVAIGDVVGRGVRAAAKMAHLQSAVRAYALEGIAPSLLLERMNAFLHELEGGGMATLLYAVVDPEAEILRVASAGHPPPLVLPADGEPRYAEGPPGNPLGVAQFPTYEEVSVPLPAGSTALLYTDGLVELPQVALGEGLERLRLLAADLPVEPEELCQAVLSATLPGGRPGDDVALLAVRLEPISTDVLRLAFPADAESLAPMRRSLGRWLRAAGAGEPETYEMLVACGEAAANAIAHAYPAGEASFEVTARRDDAELEIQVRDSGRWRPPRAGSRGRGLALMESLVDDLQIEGGEEGTTVHLRRRLSRAKAHA